MVTPLNPIPHPTVLDSMESFSGRRVVFQQTFSERGMGLTFFDPARYYRRNFGNPGPYPYSFSIRNYCSPSERFNFQGGVIRNGPPTAPRHNSFRVHLPDLTGWFEISGDLCGDVRGAIAYRPSVSITKSKPLVIWLHGTGGSSGSVSYDLFNQEEAHRVFGDEAVILILEARSFMPEDWEHHGINHDHFWNTTDDHGDSNQDILFVDALIRATIQHYGVDRQRVFMMGHSNGGFAAIHQSMALREQVRGIAVSSAGWVRYPYKHHAVSSSTDCSDILREGALTYMSPRNQLHWTDSFPYLAFSPIYDAPRPVSDFPNDHRPAIYQRFNQRDEDVAAFYACDWDRRLRERGYTEVSTHGINWINPDNPRDGYHFVDRQFLRDAWDYLQNLPPRP